MKIRSAIKRSIFLIIIGYTGICIGKSLDVSPIKIEIPANKNNSSFTVKNSGGNKTLLQVRVVKWTQKNGNDVYTETKDILINPPIIDLNTDEAQLFRVGLRKPVERTTEQAYRLFIKEVPKLDASNEIKVNTILEIGLPVFLEPAKIEKKLVWNIKTTKDGYNVVLNNQSNVHIQITHLDLYKVSQQQPFLSQDTFVYLLPNQRKTWTFKTKNIQGNTITVKALTDWGNVFDNIPLS